MENVKNSQNVSVNPDSLNHGLNENPQNLEKLTPVSSEEPLSFWDDFCNDYYFYDCLSDFEFCFCATSMMDFDYE